MRRVIGLLGTGALAGTAVAFALPASAATPARTAAPDLAVRHPGGVQPVRHSPSTSPLATVRVTATTAAKAGRPTSPLGSAAPSGGAAGSSSIVSCDSGRWPIGPTRVHAGEPNGVYLRSTGQDVVLDVTHQGEVRYQYSGTVTSAGVIRATSARMRPRDQYTVSPDGHTLTFDFKNYGGLTGVPITSKCGSSL